MTGDVSLRLIGVSEGRPNVTDEHPDFAAFWIAYPKRVQRKKASEAFSKAITKTTLPVMLTALEWQRNQPMWLKNGGEYIIYPQGWLNQERWTDEPFHAAQVSEKTLRNMKAIYGD